MLPLKKHSSEKHFFSLFFLFQKPTTAQSEIPIISEIKLDEVPAGKISKYWLHLITTGMSQLVLVPIIIAKGNEVPMLQAMLKNIPTITVEYANPQVYQPEVIDWGIRGISNLMAWLKMTDYPIEKSSIVPVIC